MLFNPESRHDRERRERAEVEEEGGRANQLDAQRVPLASGDWEVRALELRALAVEEMVNADVALDGVRTGDVVIARILHAPNDSARLVFLAAHGLELHFHEAVFQSRSLLECERITRRAGLLQRMGLARCGGVGHDGPHGFAFAGLRAGPAGRQRAGLGLVKCLALGSGGEGGG